MSKEDPTFCEKMAAEGKVPIKQEITTLIGGQRIISHHASVCQQQESCCIHKPSNHHMKNWKMNWRNDTRVMERICEHGVGHPDPDHLAHARQFLRLDEREWDSIHGCDGCCNDESCGDEVARHAFLKKKGLPSHT